MASADQPNSLTINRIYGPVDATVVVPGSKSITNRAMLVAALADGESVIEGALFSDDTRFMSGALNQLGINVETDAENARFVVGGQGGAIPATEADLFVGNAGTAMRFLVAALTLGHGSYRVDGVPRMRKRPIAPLIQALIELGAEVRSEAGNGCPPVQIAADGLAGGSVAIDGGQSSQYFSALLMTAPYASNGVRINTIGDLVSKPYMPMTARVMSAFGVEAKLDTELWQTFSVAPGQHYLGRHYLVEPDASNASYFFAAAAVTGGRVRIEGLGSESTQGDLHFVDVLAAMGAGVTVGDDYVEVQGPKDGELRGVDLDLNAISDTAQTLAAVAPFASSPTTIRGVSHARLKETDRVAAMAKELRRMGQTVDEYPDGLKIYPAPIRPAEIETYDDHRMAMAFAIAGLRADGITILDPGCVAKTFPDYFARLNDLAQSAGTPGTV